MQNITKKGMQNGALDKKTEAIINPALSEAQEQVSIYIGK